MSKLNKHTLSSKLNSKLDSAGIYLDKYQSQWEEGLTHLKQYIELEGHTKVPRRYRSADGYNLGSWVGKQKLIRDKMSPDRKSKLDAIEFVWSPLQSQWEKGFTYLKQYIETEGHVKVPVEYKCADGYKLGSWISIQRVRKDNLTFERRARLDSLGLDWDPLKSQWEKGFSYLEQYVNTEGHTKVPKLYKTTDGYLLGYWVITQRKKKNILTSERRARLDSLGFDLDPLKSQWEKGFVYLKQYAETEGHVMVPAKYKCAGGYKLGSWVVSQRVRKEKTTPKQRAKLDLLGFDWDPLKSQWDEGFSHLEQYVNTEGHTKVPRSYKTVDGYMLGHWIARQRQFESKLSSERRARLRALKFDRDPLQSQWEKGILLLTQYVEIESHARVPSKYISEDGFKLGSWVVSLRSRKDKVTFRRRSKLDALGFDWGRIQSQRKKEAVQLEKSAEINSCGWIRKQPTLEKLYDLDSWISTNRLEL